MLLFFGVTAALAARPVSVWTVESAGHVSTLLGTCHAGMSLEAALPPPLDKRLNRARVAYTEIDLSPAGAMAGLREFWSTVSVADTLGVEAWRRLARSHPSIPASMLDHLPLWMAAGMPEGAVDPADLKRAPTPMDAEVSRRAAAHSVPLRHVETAEQQARMLEAASGEIAAELRAPPDPAAQEAAQRALDAVCFEGSEDLSLLAPSADPTSLLLLGDRNRAWLPTLEPELREGGAFVAVGAAHMLGPDGLVAHLRADGFTVTRELTDAPPATPYHPTRHPEGVVAPPPDEAAVEAWLAGALPGIVAAQCAPDSVARQCIFRTDEACTTRVTRDAGLCIAQSPGLADPATYTPAAAQAFQTCVTAGFLFDALLHDQVADGAQCRLLRSIPGLAG